MTEHECGGERCKGSFSHPETTFIDHAAKASKEACKRYFISWNDLDGFWDNIHVDTMDDVKLIKHAFNIAKKGRLTSFYIIDAHTGKELV